MSVPPPPPTANRGAFEILNRDDLKNFNIKPLNVPDPIPEEQRALNAGVYGARGVLNLMEEKGVFAEAEDSLDEFRTRLLQVAEVGCTGSNVKSKLATNALEQIRNEIVLRKGRQIKYRYLLTFLRWVGGVAAVAALVALASQPFGAFGVVSPGCAGIRAYALVVIGSMFGAWISAAASRREIAFEDIPDFIDTKEEPWIRTLFVALVALALGLFLDQGFLAVEVAGLELSEFNDPGKSGVALLLGVISGISEKAVSVQLIERARGVVKPSRD